MSEIGSRMDSPCLTKEIAKEIATLWNDTAIQVDIFMTNEFLRFSFIVVLWCIFDG